MNRHLVAIRPHRCPDDSPLGKVTKTGDRSNIATDRVYDGVSRLLMTFLGDKQ